jgi:hypothetical protein
MRLVKKTLTQTTSSGRVVERTYHVHIPTQGSQGRPLLFFFHGHGGSGVHMASTPGFEQWANKGYVMVFPDGLIGPDGRSGWRTLATPPHTGPSLDQDFVERMIASMKSLYAVDGSKIYCGAFSQGTDLCWQMYTKRADLVQGFCTAGCGITKVFMGMIPSTLRPWMTVIGRQEEMWLGDERNLGAEETTRYVCELNGCSPIPVPSEGSATGMPKNPTTGTKLTTYDFPAAKAVSAAVGAGKVDRVTVDAGHRWFNRGDGDNFNMTGLCIKFWRDHAGLPDPL